MAKPMIMEGCPGLGETDTIIDEVVADCFHRCMCSCHRIGGEHISHIQACCRLCLKCYGNIMDGLMEFHLKDCHGEGDVQKK